MYAYASSFIIARYAAYGKFSILVKALPKLILYGKYGTQRVVLRRNIALGFAFVSHPLFSCHTFHIALTAML